MAWGLTGLMRNLPVHSTRGQVFLPASISTAHGVSLRSLAARRGNRRAWRPALKSLRHTARRSLELFRREAEGLPREARLHSCIWRWSSRICKRLGAHQASSSD